MKQVMTNKSLDIVVKYFFPVAAGIETNILQTYKVLVEKGWTVRIHTSKDTLTEKNVLSDYELIEGIHVHRYEYKPWGYIPNIEWNKTNLVCLHNFNVVPHFYIMLRTIKEKLLGRKTYALMLTPHGGFTPDWNIFSPLVKTVKWLYHYTVGTVLINLSVDMMRAVSEWEYQEIVKKGVQRKRVIVISNGVEDEAYLDNEKLAGSEIRKKVASYKKYILQIGRIYKIKNYETTLKALVSVPKDIHYVIAGPVGDDAYLAKLQRLIKELGLTNRVHFAGVIRGVDKYYLIKHAQMMVHMAFWESFCNVIHEGMSQGLVCIVANNTALPLLIKNNVNGFTLPTTDDKAVAEKINYVLNNSHTKQIKSIKKANRTFGLQHSWRGVALKMHELYLALSNKYE